MKNRIFAILMLIGAMLAFSACKEEPGAEAEQETPGITEELPEEEPEEKPDTSKPHVHNFKAWRTVKSATCTESGKRTRECRECGYKENGTITKKGHTPGEWVELSVASCTTDGEQYRECTACGAEVSRETVKAFGHDYRDALVYPNRYGEGYTLSVCSSCSEGYKGDFAAPHGVVSFLYTVDEEDNCVIAKVFPGEVCDIHIPEYISDRKVVAIADEALTYDNNVTAVRIPAGVRTVGDRAFIGCSALSEITFSEGVESIGRSALDSCVSLTELTLPESLTELGEGAFAGCVRLEAVNIPSGITEIPARLLKGCAALTSLTFDEAVSLVGDYAFAGCSALTELPALTSVSYIGSFAFSDCESLLEIRFTDSLETIGRSAFLDVFSLKKVIIPSIERWLSIGFMNAYSNPLNESAVLFIESDTETPLTDIAVPGTVMKIHDYAFYGYDHLRGIAFTYNNVEIGKYSFAHCGALEAVSLIRMYTVDDYAFYGCASLASIDVTEYVTYIGDFSFAGCSSIGSIEIPEVICYLGRAAFLDCASLTRAVIPSAVDVIPASLFKGCSSLRSITLPDNITLIEKDAFSGCSSLKEIALPECLEEIESGAFLGCESLRELIIPECTWKIGESAFSGAVSLEYVKVPESLTLFAENAFLGCDNVAIVEIPDILLWISIKFGNAHSNPLAGRTIIVIDGEELHEFLIPGGVSEISPYSLVDGDGIDQIYFNGSEDEFLEMYSETNLRITRMLLEERVSFYSPTRPAESGNYWHYNEYGVICKW